MKKNNTTYYHLVLDKSGSMSTHYQQTLEALNEKIKSIKQIQRRNSDMPIEVTLSFFSNDIELFVQDQKPEKLRLLKESDYQVDGMTALLDAVGMAMNRMEYLHGHAIRTQNATAMIVIFTDGHENASKMFSFREVADRIRELQATGKWTFVFVGADIDAWQTAERLNFQQSKVYSSKKESVKDTMIFLGQQLEENIKHKKKGTVWKGFFQK